MKHKICYILPEYREDSATHFSYIGSLLNEANKELETYLIIEKGNYPRANFGCEKILLIDSSNILFRAIKLFSVFINARKNGYRDFYVHYSFLSAIIASLIARPTGGRVFYWNCGEPWKYKRFFFREIFERLAYKLVTFLVTGTEKLGGEYTVHYGISAKKIKILPNWVDTERFKNIPDKELLREEFDIPEGKKVIFFAHHLSRRKGSRIILPVVRDLLAIRKDFYMIVAGSGPDEINLRDRVRGSSVISPYVRFVGAIPNREIQKYFGVADIFFLPSQEEGFPRVILEAMSASVPIVGSDVGSVKEIVPPSLLPYIINSIEAKDFIQPLNDLLSLTPTELAQIKSTLATKAKEYNTQTVAQKFTQLFTKGSPK